jgi:hypothetical protein
MPAREEPIQSDLPIGAFLALAVMLVATPALAGNFGDKAEHEAANRAAAEADHAKRSAYENSWFGKAMGWLSERPNTYPNAPPVGQAPYGAVSSGGGGNKGGGAAGCGCQNSAGRKSGPV